jgi:hypothetical protein
MIPTAQTQIVTSVAISWPLVLSAITLLAMLSSMIFNWLQARSLEKLADVMLELNGLIELERNQPDIRVTAAWIDDVLLPQYKSIEAKIDKARTLKYTNDLLGQAKMLLADFQNLHPESTQET